MDKIVINITIELFIVHVETNLYKIQREHCSKCINITTLIRAFSYRTQHNSFRLEVKLNKRKTRWWS